MKMVSTAQLSDESETTAMSAITSPGTLPACAPPLNLYTRFSFHRNKRRIENGIIIALNLHRKKSTTVLIGTSCHSTRIFEMQINQSTGANSLYQPKNEQSVSTKTASDNSNKHVSGEQVSISPAGHSAEAKWQQIAAKYDVTNISTNDRATMAAELRGNGLISTKDQMAMMAPLSMNDDLETKVDFLSINRESLAVERGEPSALKLLALLEQLHALANNGGNVQGSIANNLSDV